MTVYKEIKFIVSTFAPEGGGTSPGTGGGGGTTTSGGVYIPPPGTGTSGGGTSIICPTNYHLENGLCVQDSTAPPLGIDNKGWIRGITISQTNVPGASVIIQTLFRNTGTSSGFYSIRIEIPSILIDEIYQTSQAIPAGANGNVFSQFKLPSNVNSQSITGTLKLYYNGTDGNGTRLDDQEPITIPIVLSVPNPCPSGYQLVDGLCRPIPPTPNPCPTGYHLNSNNVCVADSPSNPPPNYNPCPTGYHLDPLTNQCVPDPYPCPTGYTLQNGVCVPIGQNPCPANYHLDASGHCVADANPCPANYHVENGHCVPDPNPCPAGYHISNGQCVADANPCPTGYVLQNGVCVPTGTPPPSGTTTTATVTLSQTSVKRGKSFKVVGAGFGPNETVDQKVIINGKTAGKDSQKTTSTGSFKETVNISSKAPKGMAVYTAKGKSTGKTASASITIT